MQNSLQNKMITLGIAAVFAIIGLWWLTHGTGTAPETVLAGVLQPVVGQENATPDGMLVKATVTLLTPGVWALSAIGLRPDTRFELLLALVLSLWMTGTGLRLLYCIPGRLFGFWNPEHFRFFLWIPWRRCLAGILWVRGWWEQIAVIGTRATAGFAGPLSTMIHVFNPSRGDIFVGRLQAAGIGLFQPIGIPSEKHFVMVAGAGAGKTALVTTQCAYWRGNLCAVDPQGAISRTIAARRGRGGDGIFGLKRKMRVLSPYPNVVPSIASAHWNALDEIDIFVKREGRAAAVRVSTTMAEGLIKIDSDKPFFPLSARAFLKGLILFVWLTETPELRNLVRVRALLTRGMPEKALMINGKREDPFAALLREMETIEDFDGVVAKAAATLAGTGVQARGDVLATARQQTAFLDFPEVAAISQRSTFSLAELKTGQLDLFICAPVSDIQSKLSGWFRMITVMALYHFESIPGRPKNGCLFVIDEFPSLGHIETVSAAAPTLRSYGVQLLAITQDLERLQMVYPKEWGGFLGNAELVWWMGTNHEGTVSYLEKVLGTKTIRQIVNGQERKEDRPVVHAEQLKRFLDPQRGNMAVTRNGRRPLLLKTAPYFKELPVYLYTANKNFPEKFLRAITRHFFRWLLPAMPVPDLAAEVHTMNPPTGKSTHDKKAA